MGDIDNNHKGGSSIQQKEKTNITTKKIAQIYIFIVLVESDYKRTDHSAASFL